MPPAPHQPIASQIARLPLAKFSHTTTSINHGGPLGWNHINGRGSLMCVFDRFTAGPAQPPRLILRVTNNRGILVLLLSIVPIDHLVILRLLQEQLDLEHFVRAAAAQSRATANPTAKPLFAVVVMSPCLAVKYAQNETHVCTKLEIDDDGLLSYIDIPRRSVDSRSSSPKTAITTRLWRY